jgi:hypothetical protein
VHFVGFFYLFFTLSNSATCPFHIAGNMASSSGSKVSYVLTFQLSSPNLTFAMMESVGLFADEIVISRDSALVYAYVHLQRKIREEELETCIRMLASTHSLKQSNLFGYETITSSTPSASEPIEDLPAFRILVQHDITDNENFSRLTADGFSGKYSGYNLLKNKLLSKSAPGPSADRGGAGGGEGGYGGRARNDEEHIPHTRPSGLDHEGESKRQKTGNSDGSGPDFVLCDYVKKILEKDLAETRILLDNERTKREAAESKYKLLEQRHNVEAEFIAKYRPKVLD